VTSIGNGTFAGCPATMFVDAGNPAYMIQDSVLYDKAQTKLFQCMLAKKGYITIPATVTNIQPYAFYKCIGLTYITIPESVNNIGIYAFEP
jgi:hypothetical protein